MDYIIINTENHFLTFFITFFCTIFPVLPFIVVDIYYSLFYETNITCLDSTYFKHITMKMWLLINGSISIFSVVFTLFIFTVLYTKKCLFISDFFQNIYFIKGYILLKLSFNIIWSIIGTLIFIDIYNTCLSNLKIYICIRLSIIFLFILFSIRKIKNYLLNLNNPDEELNNINNTNI